ncbi:MAG: helix-turn-helix transcriptional regulator [Saprospiraceae bacterium]|nr:helix-turn-helix transcriptional regulator [Saprospiraceae bacterium]
MINMQEFIEGQNMFKKYHVDDLLFVEFRCPTDESADSVWWHNNLFAYVLTGETRLKSLHNEYVLRERDCIFAKKGSITIQSHIQENFCQLMVFMPDDFIRTTVRKYKITFKLSEDQDHSDTLIPIPNDDIIDSYFQSLAVHFSQNNSPNPELLRLKFEELIINILTSRNRYQSLRHYFQEICLHERPSLKDIMEMNFHKNLSLEEYARLTARSLTTFKQEFKKLFNTSPGKWLKNKRLDYSRYLLETTKLSIDDVCDLSGFKNKSHFTNAFKEKFESPPAQFRNLQQ